MTSNSDVPGVWCHAVVTTYGAWLPGDRRGFRTRHHREHVEGDYRNPPPPTMYESRRDQSSAQLKQPPVTLSPNWRAAVGLALLEKLTELGCQVLVVAVAGQHAHLLVKLPNGDARHWIGLAKKNASFAIHAAGWQGRLWGMRSKIVRIRDHEQQLNTFRYILKHQAEGAWTYDFRSQR